MRVVVAMSGGVDSSVAAARLKAEGHEVLGMTLRVWTTASEGQCGRCCSPDDVDDARRVADRLGIPFYVVNAEELFRERVVTPFVQAYVAGTTPVPCVACNSDLKFGFLLARARQLGAKLATGHYARAERTDGAWTLRRGVDAAKDQSYFLFTLGQGELPDVLFPVGALTKAEVRAEAARWGFATAQKPESMELCFVPDGDYAGFVERVAGPQPDGDIVDADGRVLGRHRGVHRFTVGQRRGLDVAAREALFVKAIDAGARRLVVAGTRELEARRLRVARLSWVSGSPPEAGRALTVRVRHRHGGAPCVLEPDDGRLRGDRCVTLEVPVRAVTPGQAAVFYDSDEVLGGGFIVAEELV